MELQNSQIANILYRLLKSQGVRVVEGTIRDKLFSHPEFPSLTSFSDVCKEINVSNITFETSFDKIQESYCPFIAHLLSDGGCFVLVNSVDKKKNEIIYYHPIHKKVKENIDVFLRKWSRIIFCIETNNSSGEDNYKSKLLSGILSSFGTYIYIISFISLLIYPYLFMGRFVGLDFVLLLLFKLIGFFYLSEFSYQ
ncbi:MAG: cysteine peptidase family C39 domain-containing protein [Parabacteroides sp.]|nr:cysteine peptidase family C39 domain-containing protein [Parabacteroides sp.]